MNRDIIVGKHTLESLSIGMYSNPFTIYREYIQNAVDQLDKAINNGLITSKDAYVEIKIDHINRTITVLDNGTGIPQNDAYIILGDIGNSMKDYRKHRGFRGIGRLGGLGYSKKLIFSTSYQGESSKTNIVWDCNILKELLHPSNKEVLSVTDVIKACTSESREKEKKEAHYFSVQLIDVEDHYIDLLDEKKVQDYLCKVAPVPFDAQKFPKAMKIKEYLKEQGKPLDEYRIHLNGSSISIMKPYKNQFDTGHQQRTKKIDIIRDIEFFYDRDSNGELTYLGWIGISNFYGSIKSDAIRGIRLRKGNILIGDESTFSRFFTSEGDTSNASFMGEVYIFDPDIVPNAKRDDFEKNKAYHYLFNSLNSYANQIKSKYRYGMSNLNSAIKSLEKGKEQLKEIRKHVETGTITSDHQRELLLRQRADIEKNINQKTKDLERVITKESLDDESKEKAKSYIKHAQTLKKEAVSLQSKIINADYATKYDLPTSYSKNERKLYQRIIKVIDTFFGENRETVELLRKKIIEELSDNKK